MTTHLLQNRTQNTKISRTFKTLPRAAAATLPLIGKEEHLKQFWEWWCLMLAFDSFYHWLALQPHLWPILALNRNGIVLYLDHKQNKNESRNRRDIVRASHKEKRKTEPQIQWRSWDRPKNSSSLLINLSWKITDFWVFGFLRKFTKMMR